MQTGNFTNISWNNQAYATVLINGEDIIGLNGEKIGVTLKKYNEIEDGLKKCKDKLIELGVIKVPKTQEEILKEQQDLIEKQNKAINSLLERLNNEQETITKPVEPSTTECEKQMETSSGQSSDNGEPRGDKQPSTSKTGFGKFKCSK